MYWLCTFALFSDEFGFTLLPRVHNISVEGECLTAYIPCTIALRQVTPVNYCILTDLIYA